MAIQLLPDKEKSRPFAVVLLCLLLALIYLIGFHWFVMRHVDLGNEISDTRDDIARFIAEVNQREEIEGKLKEIRAAQQNSSLYLSGTSFDRAAAELTQRLKEIINTKADHDYACAVISNRNVRPREAERFEKVLVEVRMRCNLADFVKILFELEHSTPLVFIDGVNVYQRYTEPPRENESRRQASRQNYAELDIRFNMYGYLGVENSEFAQSVAGL